MKFKQLLAFMVLSGTAFAGDYSTWAGNMNIVVNTTGVTTALVQNIPILVRFNGSQYPAMFTGANAAMAAGADLRFTKADGTTDLPFEIETWTTGASGSGAVWVRIDSVRANSANGATIRVHWGKAGSTTMSSPATTFATASGYQAVFHMNEASGNVTDAANGYVGTAMGTFSAGGIVGSARDFHGSQPNATTAAENYISFAPGATAALSTHTGPITLEAWVLATPVSSNGNTSAGTKQILAHTTSAGDGAYLFRSGTGAPGNYYGAGGTAAQVETNIGPRTPFGEQNYWAYISAVYDGTNWIIRRQRDGDPWGVPTIEGGETTPAVVIAGAGPVASTNPWFIGAWSSDGTTSGTLSRPWAGTIDEVRISTVARDSNYIRLNYESQRMTASLVTVGVKPETSGPAARFATRATASGVFFILPAGLRDARIAVTDVHGREVWSRKVTTGAREMEWNKVSSSGTRLAQGIYTARLVTSGSQRPVVAAESRIVLTR